MEPISQTCASLRRKRQSIYAKAKNLRLTGRTWCRICHRIVVSSGHGKLAYCSPECRRRANTISHSRFVAANRVHVNRYSRERRIRFWGISSPELAEKAERLAMEKILPRLGFTELYHASAIKRYVPFDLIATYQGNRVLVDVTTGVTKAIGQNAQQSFADALRMPLYVLFVKPDFTKYQLILSSGSRTLSVQAKALITIE